MLTSEKAVGEAVTPLLLHVPTSNLSIGLAPTLIATTGKCFPVFAAASEFAIRLTNARVAAFLNVHANFISFTVKNAKAVLGFAFNLSIVFADAGVAALRTGRNALGYSLLVRALREKYSFC